jgi:hypothetical protein
VPETYGLEGPEPERAEQVRDAVEQAIAGQGIIRRVVLWTLVVTGLALGVTFPPAAIIGTVAAVLLIATDKGLS